MLYYTCSNCKSEYRFKSKAKTRVDLAMENSRKLIFTCEDCGYSKEVSINDIQAKPSKIVRIAAGLFLVLGTLIVLFYIWKIAYSDSPMSVARGAAFLFVPVFIYIVLNQAETYRVKTFNKTYVNDNTPETR